MQPRIISTYADVLGEIERLEAPHPGRVRVFRGQTKDYGRMLPSGLRRPLRNEFAWHYYAMLLARELLGTHNEKSQPWDAKMLTFWDKEAVWIKALAQHYGPGSIFLDITRSLDVAVWFALHSAERVKADSDVGPLDPGSPAEDTTQEEWMDYCKWNAEGFLFVFDVPECPASSPGHGQLLDLSKARPIFSESRRIKGQAAYLIAADPDINGGDLQNFVREVIRVQWPMQNAPRLDLPIEEMFPEPSQDEWYKLLVSIPLTYQLHEETGNLNLARPLEVLLYFYKARNKTKEILHQSRHVPRARLHLSDTLKMKLVSGESPKVSEFRLSEATHILLETPIIAWVPPANSEMWNHGILAGDMTDSIDAFEGPTDEACCSLSLKNLYIEFSPLEVTGWEQLNDPNGRIDLLGGLWIVRNETHFALRLFPQVVKSPRVCTVQDSPPFHYDYRSVDGKFWRLSPGKPLWNVAGDRHIDKAFFTALALSRFLSPLKKADPFPSQQQLRDDGIWKLTIPVRQEAVRLRRALEKKDNRCWYVPRDARSGQPFFFEDAPAMGNLCLESHVPWSSLHASDIGRLIAEKCP